MKIPFTFTATATTLSFFMAAHASRGLPADIETLDKLWLDSNASCKSGNQEACQMRDNYQKIIKRDFPNAVPAFCPPSMGRMWFETGRHGMAAGCRMPETQAPR